MEIVFTKEDLQSVQKFIEKSSFVNFMNEQGLSLSAMGFILQTLEDKCKEVKQILNKDDN